jgi:hypothetical protein
MMLRALIVQEIEEGEQPAIFAIDVCVRTHLQRRRQ